MIRTISNTFVIFKTVNYVISDVIVNNNIYNSYIFERKLEIKNLSIKTLNKLIEAVKGDK